MLKYLKWMGLLMFAGCLPHYPWKNETREPTRKMYYVFSANTLYFDDHLKFAYSVSVTFNGYAKLHEYNSDSCAQVDCPNFYYRFKDKFLSDNKDSVIDIRFTKDWTENYSLKINPADWGKADTIYGVYWKR